MDHHGQGLTLGIEAGHDLPGVHAQLDDLQGDPPAQRPFLLGHVDDRHTPFTDLLEELVRPDDCARALDRGRWHASVAITGLGGGNQLHDAPGALPFRRAAWEDAAAPGTLFYVAHNHLRSPWLDCVCLCLRRNCASVTRICRILPVLPDHSDVLVSFLGSLTARMRQKGRLSLPRAARSS